MNRHDQYWPVSGFASDQPIKDPPMWVVIVAAIVIVAGVFAYPLWRDEHAATQNEQVRP